MEKYLAIIAVLDNWDLKTQEQIMRKSGLNLTSPREYFNFLIKLDLIREKNVENKTVFSITSKGKRICSYFRQNNNKSIFGGNRIIRIY